MWLFVSIFHGLWWYEMYRFGKKPVFSFFGSVIVALGFYLLVLKSSLVSLFVAGGCSPGNRVPLGWSPTRKRHVEEERFWFDSSWCRSWARRVHGLSLKFLQVLVMFYLLLLCPLFVEVCDFWWGFGVWDFRIHITMCWWNTSPISLDPSMKPPLSWTVSSCNSAIFVKDLPEPALLVSLSFSTSTLINDLLLWIYMHKHSGNWAPYSSSEDWVSLTCTGDSNVHPFLDIAVWFDLLHKKKKKFWCMVWYQCMLACHQRIPSINKDPILREMDFIVSLAGEWFRLVWSGRVPYRKDVEKIKLSCPI